MKQETNYLQVLRSQTSFFHIPFLPPPYQTNIVLARHPHPVQHNNEHEESHPDDTPRSSPTPSVVQHHQYRHRVHRLSSTINGVVVCTDQGAPLIVRVPRPRANAKNNHPVRWANHSDE